jgi:hypothetical protein
VPVAGNNGQQVTVEAIPQIFASLLNLMRYRYPDISTVTLESVRGTAVPLVTEPDCPEISEYVNPLLVLNCH